MYPKLTGRFGVEIELNSLDGRNFIATPLKRGEMPFGIERVSEIVRNSGFDCEVHDWRYDHNPETWSCKPDNSCGIELCSPVMQVGDYSALSSVMNALSSESSLSADENCSFHVHFELSSMECDDELGSILSWWVKCEHVFFDFARPHRKNNRYCRPIGLTDILDSDDVVASEIIFKKLSFKYLSLNTFHVFNRRRPTIEFRIAEGTMDSQFASNWVDLLMSFCGKAVISGLPADYLWLSPREVFDFMELESDLEGWFLSRLNCESCASEFFSPARRMHAMNFYSSRARLNSIEAKNVQV